MPQELLERRDVHGDTPEPFGPTVRVGDTSATALDLMVAGAHDMLPVVTDEPMARFAGVVLRKALENGCLRMGHDVHSCRLHKHLKTDVTVVMESTTAGSIAPRRRRLIVVLDSSHRPIGFLRRDR